MPDTAIRIELGRFGFYYGALAACATLALLQTALGGDPWPCLMLSGALYFGLLSAHTAGLLSAIGLLNLILVVRVLVGAYFAKNVLLGDPITEGLLSPDSTSAAMLLGFAGVWLGTLVVVRFVRPLRWFGGEADVRQLRAIFVAMLVAGLATTVAVRLSGSDGLEITGGGWGVVKTIASMRSLALPILMLLLWRSGARRWLMHPGVLALAVVLFAIGILSTSKQAMAEPVVFYVLMALARYGWRHPIIWIGLPAALAFFQFFVYPISQYSRYSAVTESDPRRAAAAALDLVVDYARDSSFREYVQQYAKNSVRKDDGTGYLPERIVFMQRFAMLGEADRLISATDRLEYTRWDTIETSLLIVIPKFLYPNKPQLGAGNFLARFSGDLPPTDYITMVSYGFIANAYNAFGLLWVLPLTFVTLLLFAGPLSLVSSGPAYASVWSIFVLASMHQVYAESSFTGIISAFTQVAFAFLFFGMAALVQWIENQVGWTRTIGAQAADVHAQGRP